MKRRDGKVSGGGRGRGVGEWKGARTNRNPAIAEPLGPAAAAAPEPDDKLYVEPELLQDLMPHIPSYTLILLFLFLSNPLFLPPPPSLSLSFQLLNLYLQYMGKFTLIPKSFGCRL